MPEWAGGFDHGEDGSTDDPREEVQAAETEALHTTAAAETGSTQTDDEPAAPTADEQGDGDGA